MNILRQQAAQFAPDPPRMSTKTKIFIQKVCYKKTASVDMTTHGFVSDTKFNTVNLLLKHLRERLVKIWGDDDQRDEPTDGKPAQTTVLAKEPRKKKMFKG